MPSFTLPRGLVSTSSPSWQELWPVLLQWHEVTALCVGLLCLCVASCRSWPGACSRG